MRRLTHLQAWSCLPTHTIITNHKYLLPLTTEQEGSNIMSRPQQREAENLAPMHR